MISDIVIEDRRLNLERMVLTRTDGSVIGVVGNLKHTRFNDAFRRFDESTVTYWVVVVY